MFGGRLWSFVKRHRKKFIFSAICAGGAYAAWRVLLPRLQEQLLQRLLKELARGDDVDVEAERRTRFEHKQQVSDAHARRKLVALRARQNEHFEEDACSTRLREASDRDAKLAALKLLQVECLARAVSALYTLHAALLLHRIAFNIVGREMAAASSATATLTAARLADAAGGAPGDGAAEGDADESAHASFLASLDYLQEEEGSLRIAKAIRRAVEVCGERVGFTPLTPVSREAVEQLVAAACREADLELLAPPIGAAALLPDGLEGRTQEQYRPEVKRLLDEARDYLESPQVLQVFQVTTASAARRLSEGLQEELGGGPGPWPLVKLFGPLTKMAGALLDGESAGELDGSAFVGRFAAEPRVGELCEGLYFQEAAKR